MLVTVPCSSIFSVLNFKSSSLTDICCFFFKFLGRRTVAQNLQIHHFKFLLLNILSHPLQRESVRCITSVCVCRIADAKKRNADILA